jgi:hypothetical protein
MVDLIPCPISEERWRKPNEEEDLKVYTRRRPMVEERWRKPNEEENLNVYTRRQSRHEQQAPQGSNLLQEVLKLLNCLMGKHAPRQLQLIQEIQWTCPLPLRKGIRAGNAPTRYSDEHDISPSYRAFIASLQSVMIPRDWKAAKQDPKWH